MAIYILFQFLTVRIIKIHYSFRFLHNGGSLHVLLNYLQHLLFFSNKMKLIAYLGTCDANIYSMFLTCFWLSYWFLIPNFDP